MNQSRGSIMQVISSGGIYGAERVVLDLATYFARQSWDSRVVAIDSAGADALLALAQERGLRTHKIPAHRYLPHTLRALREYVVREKIGIVHSHGYKADMLVQWSALSRHARTVATCHTWYSDSWRMKVYEHLDKRSLRGFDHVAVVSPQLEAEVRDCGVAAERVSLIRNGTTAGVPQDDARVRIRSEFGFAADDFVLVRVGRLANSKGNDILLRSVAGDARLASAKVLFVGDGEEKEALVALARETGLESRVAFTGYRADIPDLLAAGDLFVLPSIKEGLPIALLEAMSVPLPIVSTDAGAISMALEHLRNAWVVRAGDAQGLTGALVQAVARPDLCDYFAAAALEDFRRWFSIDAMGASYAAVYERLGRATVVQPALSRTAEQ